jgi:hypothetical protein
MYKNFKVFDITSKDDVKDLFHKYGINCTESPKLYFFKIEKNPKGDDEGLGYLTDLEINKITNWLIDNGAKINEVVIIDNYW